jgi:bis(5'-adenosyl)-triphosphatase
MWLLVRRVQNVLKNAYPKTTAFNIAVQDGKDAGQSVQHVHVHILPRHSKDDFEERNDDVYDKLEQWAPTLLDEKNKIKSNIDVPNDNERIDRTEEMMTNEANMYRKLLLELELSESVSK